MRALRKTAAIEHESPVSSYRVRRERLEDRLLIVVVTGLGRSAPICTEPYSKLLKGRYTEDDIRTCTKGDTRSLAKCSLAPELHSFLGKNGESDGKERKWIATEEFRGAYVCIP